MLVRSSASRKATISSSRSGARSIARLTPERPGPIRAKCRSPGAGPLRLGLEAPRGQGVHGVRDGVPVPAVRVHDGPAEHPLLVQLDDVGDSPPLTDHPMAVVPREAGPHHGPRRAVEPFRTLEFRAEAGRQADVGHQLMTFCFFLPETNALRPGR